MRVKFGNIFVSFIIPILVALFNIFIIFYPREILDAAREGINLWFNNIFPSLLPFIVGTNILIGLGVVSFIGTLLEPIMNPLFRVSGSGAFALVVGVTSGYPMGAKVTAGLRESEAITKHEAQRLAGFCNNSGPLFILGAVAAGMFRSVAVGYFILITHYIGAICTGLILRYYKYEKRSVQNPISNKNLLTLAVKNMKDSKKEDGRSFGKLLGDSIKNAMETILIVGGFVIIFRVIVKIFEITGIVYILTPLATVFNLPTEAFIGILVGFIEVTNGVKILSDIPLATHNIIITAGIISFGGLSVLAQSANFLGKTDINIFLYFISKIIHATITVILSILLVPFFNFETTAHASRFYSNSVMQTFMYSSLYFFSSLLFIGVATIFLVSARRQK